MIPYYMHCLWSIKNIAVHLSVALEELLAFLKVCGYLGLRGTGPWYLHRGGWMWPLCLCGPVVGRGLGHSGDPSEMTGQWAPHPSLLTDHICFQGSHGFPPAGPLPSLKLQLDSKFGCLCI